MTNTDHLYLDRLGQKHVIGMLRQIPRIVADLAVTITRRDVISRPMPGGRSSVERVEMPLPLNVDAMLQADRLRTLLAGYCANACMYRGLIYAPTLPPGYTHWQHFIGPLQANERRIPEGWTEEPVLSLARWLNQNLIAFAMTENSEHAPTQLRNALKACTDAIDLPPDEICKEPDQQAIDQSYDMLLTARELQNIMPQLGEKPLKADTIHSWTDRKRYKDNALAFQEIAGVKGYVYRLGDVLAIRRAREAARSQRMSEVS
ncbi:hypothetical protein [Rhodococcoides fascians]|uniref:hypothetical protein n=1 Tax=Rhodococcoides fascians TaxID=1828 RepID=UPI00055B9DCA|nr:hypothetical protein [Rhodococcus fascians]